MAIIHVIGRHLYQGDVLINAVVDTHLFESFCRGLVYARVVVLDAEILPRFREIFRESDRHAAMMRESNEPAMVSLAQRFDAEIAAQAAMDAVNAVLATTMPKT